MPKNEVHETDIPCGDETKRALLKSSLGAIAAVTVTGTSSLAQTVLAGEVTAIKANAVNIQYRESELGINYRELAPSPLAEMLSHGEAEWMKNAIEKYGEKTGPFWARSISKTLAAGTPSQSTIEKIKRFTPEMLTNFGLLDHNNPKFQLLWSAGSVYISETA